MTRPVSPMIRFHSAGSLRAIFITSVDQPSLTVTSTESRSEARAMPHRFVEGQRRHGPGIVAEFHEGSR